MSVLQELSPMSDIVLNNIHRANGELWILDKSFYKAKSGKWSEQVKKKVLKNRLKAKEKKAFLMLDKMEKDIFYTNTDIRKEQGISKSAITNYMNFLIEKNKIIKEIKEGVSGKVFIYKVRS